MHKYALWVIPSDRSLKSDHHSVVKYYRFERSAFSFTLLKTLFNSPSTPIAGPGGRGSEEELLHCTKRTSRIKRASTPSCPKEGFGAKLVGDQYVDPLPSQRPQNGLVLLFAAGNPHHAWNAFQPCQFQAEHPETHRVHNLFSAGVEKTQTNVAHRPFCSRARSSATEKRLSLSAKQRGLDWVDPDQRHGDSVEQRHCLANARVLCKDVGRRL